MIFFFFLLICFCSQKKNYMKKRQIVSRVWEREKKKNDARFINLFLDPRQSLHLPSKKSSHVCTCTVFQFLASNTFFLDILHNRKISPYSFAEVGCQNFKMWLNYFICSHYSFNEISFFLSLYFNARKYWSFFCGFASHKNEKIFLRKNFLLLRTSTCTSLCFFLFKSTQKKLKVT